MLIVDSLYKMFLLSKANVHQLKAQVHIVTVYYKLPEPSNLRQEGFSGRGCELSISCLDFNLPNSNGDIINWVTLCSFTIDDSKKS